MKAKGTVAQLSVLFILFRNLFVQPIQPPPLPLKPNTILTAVQISELHTIVDHWWMVMTPSLKLLSRNILIMNHVSQCSCDHTWYCNVANIIHIALPRQGVTFKIVRVRNGFKFDLSLRNLMVLSHPVMYVSRLTWYHI
jgi:hypothetical protein